MTDYFSLLEIDRRPWLDPENLKEQFQKLSGAVHPDRFHQSSLQEQQLAHQRYTELNAAHQCLREPKDRLRHLLELERGVKPPEVQQIPAATMQTGLEVGQACAAADQMLAERRQRSDSPLLQATLFEKAQEIVDRLRELQANLHREQVELLEELKNLNAQWGAGAQAVGSPEREQTLPLERVEEMYRLFSYLHRWDRQLRERIVELGL